MTKHKKTWDWLPILSYALLYSIGLFILFGAVTALLSTRFFARMTDPTLWDYAYLTLTSLLLGMYISISQHYSQKSKTCTTSATGGGILGFLGFGCSICNKLLVFALGVIGVLTYIEPYKPLLGAIGVSLLGFALAKKISIITNHKNLT